ncbi:hypothetical protein KO02_09130 [Sphingobacterium sp. ML3W]|uniref:PVC-type heme-binding CxxCH protein n=1 Tax=Sphingobacterium sp. ML3W TaxID=1538644 RepID=UPI0004F8FCAE|nr:PVC-type heme-binding CxxCH protein [Sphingobacterium sp. ML3W]AIM36841.1 hypothetical protein KO02_09130 [Sphingobacterium sp. ML3W]
MKNILRLLLLFLVFFTSCQPDKPRRAEVLFIGAGNEKSSNQATWLGVELFKSGINLTYSDTLSSLDLEYLDKFDGVVLLVNQQELSADKEQALKKFLEKGKGVVALNSSANSFKNSEWFTDLVQGGFDDLGDGEVTVSIADAKNMLDSSVNNIKVNNEKYAFKSKTSNHNVIGTADVNGEKQNYIWYSEEGNGRFLYQALGKNDETWKNLHFLKVLSSGIWWSLGEKVRRLVDELAVPHVSIYPDSIADFTARYDVPRVQDPLTPEESMKLIQTPLDFELKLFASEPNITNPMAMSWDERGRLWVIEAVDYPNNFEKIKGKGNDRIVICEDTDGDGVADKFTEFAKGLNIATSLTFANDGVIVSMAPDFVFLKDTDGDDVADQEEVIMTGWSKGDTHAGPSNLQYGFDNKIWGVTGYAGYNGVINGEKHIFSQGLYRLNSDGSDFEYLATTGNNTWGLGMSEDNNVFISTANNTHSAFYSMPEKYLQRRVENIPGVNPINAIQKIDNHYEVHALTPNLRQVDVVGGFTSAAGHHMYTARDFPQSYWNSVAFVNEPTVRLIHNAIIEKDGAGFKEKDGWNLLASSDEWFGPVHSEVGPDGAVWVLDWYNFIIQHNVFVPAQAPSEKVLPFKDQVGGPGNAFESDLRDKKHGRVYRVVYKNAKHNESFKLSKDNPKELIKALNSKNKFWRTHAQRLLVERKKADVKQDLIKIINNKSVDEIGLNAPAIHAIWTLKGLGLLTDEEVNDALLTALSHPSAGVRKAAVQVLDLNAKSFDKIAKSKIFEDKNLNTRLAAFVKIADSAPFAEISTVLKAAINDPANAQDKWLSPALFAAIQTNHSHMSNSTDQVSNNTYEKQINQALGEEIYTLGRKNRVQFSPNVRDKDIIIETEVLRRDQDPYKGLIIGQGDAKDGFALYMQGNKLFWEVFNDGQKYSISSSDGIGNAFKVNASITEKDGLSLYVNNRLVGQMKEVKPFKKPLKSYLRSGEDLDESVALTKYDHGSEFIGNISEIKVKLQLNGGHVHDHMHMASAVEVNQNEAPAEVIVIKAIKDIMQYDKRSITVKAGKQITLIMENPDGMPHNLVIIKPGTTEIVGKAADEMLQASSAAEKDYIPEVSEVLFHTKLVNPGQSYTLKFQAPKEKGEYPFICTFPGHWRGMNGIMRVVD